MGPVVRCLVLQVAILCSLCVWIDYSSSAPVVRRQTAENGTGRSNSSIAWLKKFYYLPDKPDSAINDAEYQGAIAALQNAGGLEETGILNSETISLLNTPRCGVYEAQPGGQEYGNKTRKKRYYLQGTYWKKLSLTYRFLQLTPDLPEDLQKNILRKMINKWAEVSPLTITEQTNPTVNDDDVDILVRFVSGYHNDPYPFDGQGGTLAHAFYPHNNKELQVKLHYDIDWSIGMIDTNFSGSMQTMALAFICVHRRKGLTGLSGDAHFDDAERFTTGTRDGINLDWVAVHEFGHSMGLEHSNVQESIMYPWYKGYFENIELTEDDIRGIQALYGKPTVEPTKSTAEPTKTTAVTSKATSVTSEPQTPEPQTTRPQTTPSGPDICTIQKYDQIFKGENGEIYVFSGEYYWVLAATLGVKSGPTKINSRWRELGTPINAAYKRKDGRTVFFKGSQYWKYYRNRLEEGPRDIANYGLPRDLSDPDIAFIWGGNGKTYFFKGDNYWRYNEANRNIDSGYPRSIAIWGLPYAMDSALTYERNGRTYYFKDADYWKYDDGALKLLGQNYGYPKNTHKVWEKCKLPTAP